MWHVDNLIPYNQIIPALEEDASSLTVPRITTITTHNALSPTPLPPPLTPYLAANVAETDFEHDEYMQEEWQRVLDEESTSRQKQFDELVEQASVQHAKLVEDAKDYAVAFPRQAMRGSLADLAKVLLDESEVPVEFGFMSAMTVFGSIVSEKLKIAEDGLKTCPNLYTVLIAPTGGKKSTAVSKVADFFIDCELLTRSLSYEEHGNTLIFPKAGSGEGLLNLFKASKETSTGVWDRKERTRVLLTPDEFQELLHKCRLENSTLAPELTSLFDGTVAGNITKDTKSFVKNAHLAMVGCITTKLWHETWAQGTERSLGLLNRLFLVSSLPKPPVFSPPVPDKQKLEELKKRIKEQIYSINAPLAITPEAMEVFKHFYLGLQRSYEESIRLDTIVKKLAMILAITNDQKAITANIAKMAVMLGQYQFEVRQLLNPSEAQNAIAECENRVRNFLQKNPNDSFTIKRICDRTRLEKALGSGSILKALDNLEKSGTIESHGINNKRKFKIAAPEN
jgi:hypothetical protein